MSTTDVLVTVEAALRAVADAVGALAKVSASQPHAEANDQTLERVKAAKGKAGPKPAKDPNKPKRPMTSFLMYAQDRRPAYMEAHPDVKGRAVLTGIAEEWKAMTAQQKAPWESRFNKNMQDWKKDKDDYAQGAPAAAPAHALQATEPPHFVAPAVHPDSLRPSGGTLLDSGVKKAKKKKDKDKKKHKKKNREEADGQSPA